MEEKNQPRRPRRSPEEPLQKNESLVYGKNPVTELLKSGSGVDTVLIAEGMAPAVAAYYTALAKAAGATVKRVPPNKLRLMTGTESHQGVAAFASEIEYVTVDDLMVAAKDKGEAPFLVLSDGIEDPHNLGAVMRSALLCGAHGIVIPKRGGASVTPTVIKSSAGAAERLPVARVANIGETIRRLKEQGVFVYCADMDGVSLREQPDRPHCTGAGQRGQRCFAAGEKAVRRCGAVGYGSTGHRCGQLQRVGGCGHYSVRNPVPARSTAGMIRHSGRNLNLNYRRD